MEGNFFKENKIKKFRRKKKKTNEGNNWRE